MSERDQDSDERNLICTDPMVGRLAVVLSHAKKEADGIRGDSPQAQEARDNLVRHILEQHHAMIVGETNGNGASKDSSATAQ